MAYYNSQKDSFDSDNIVRPLDIRSASKGGASTTFLGVADVTIPASPNFPSTTNGSATRYFIYLPFNMWRTSTNSTEFSVTNETQSKTVTVVDPGQTLTDYTCKFSDNQSGAMNQLEVHVGSTSNSAGDSLSYQGKAIGSNLNSTNLNSLNINDLTVNNITANSSVVISDDVFITGTLAIGNSSKVEIDADTDQVNSFAFGITTYQQTTGSLTTGSTNRVQLLQINLAGWDMTDTATVVRSFTVQQPYSYELWLYDDPNTKILPVNIAPGTTDITVSIDNVSTGILANWQMTLTLSTNSFFAKSTSYTSTSAFRGYMNIMSLPS